MKQLVLCATALFGAMSLAACGSPDESKTAKTGPTSKQSGSVKISVEGFDGSEGVRYDPEMDIYFVSNCAGDNSEDANSFVSKVSADGEILQLKFMTGSERWPMHGPRGMFINSEGLWVVDADGVHLFNRETGAQLDFVDLSGFEPGFPNDIVEAGDGNLYVTDTGKSVLYRIVDGAASIATETAMKPNGITLNPATGGLLLAPWEDGENLVEWNIESGEFVSRGKFAGGGNFDGVEVVDGTAIVSSQQDTSLHFVKDGSDMKAIELPGRPADMGIDTKRNRIAVPYVSLDRVDIISLDGKL